MSGPDGPHKDGASTANACGTDRYPFGPRADESLGQWAYRVAAEHHRRERAASIDRGVHAKWAQQERDEIRTLEARVRWLEHYNAAERRPRLAQVLPSLPPRANDAMHGTMLVSIAWVRRVLEHAERAKGQSRMIETADACPGAMSHGAIRELAIFAKDLRELGE